MLIPFSLRVTPKALRFAGCALARLRRPSVLATVISCRNANNNEYQRLMNIIVPAPVFARK